MSSANEEFLETVPRCRLCKVVCENEQAWDNHCASERHHKEVDVDMRQRIESERKKIQRRLQEVDRQAEQLAARKIKSSSFQTLAVTGKKRKRTHATQPLLVRVPTKPQPPQHTKSSPSYFNSKQRPSNGQQRLPLNHQLQQDSTFFSFKQAFSSFKQAFSVASESTAINRPTHESTSSEKLFTLDGFTHTSTTPVKIECPEEDLCKSSETYKEDLCGPELSSESDEVCDLHPDSSPDDKEYHDNPFRTGERDLHPDSSPDDKEFHDNPFRTGERQVGSIFPRRKFFKMERPVLAKDNLF